MLFLYLSQYTQYKQITNHNETQYFSHVDTFRNDYQPLYMQNTFFNILLYLNPKQQQNKNTNTTGLFTEKIIIMVKNEC